MYHFPPEIVLEKSRSRASVKHLEPGLVYTCQWPLKMKRHTFLIKPVKYK